MSEPAPHALPPHVQLIQMVAASWISAVIYAAAKLGIADHLSAGPRSAVELAGVTGTHAPSLHRLMRTLAGLGILTEGDGQRFALTSLGEALKTGAPGSARSTVLAFGAPGFWRSWEEIVYSLQTGKPGFDKVWGMPVFDYLAAESRGGLPLQRGDGRVPRLGAAGGGCGLRLLGGHDARRCRWRHRQHAGGDPLEAPVGAGRAVRSAACRGEAPALLKAHGVDERVTIESGSFFEGVPSGGDAYLLSHIIHDWTEEQCLTILGHCRAAMKPTGRLLIVETVLPMGDTPHQGKLQDMVMLVVPGGQERTEAEYHALLGKAGFRLNRVVPTESVASVVEALPA